MPTVKKRVTNFKTHEKLVNFYKINIATDDTLYCSMCAIKTKTWNNRERTIDYI